MSLWLWAVLGALMVLVIGWHFAADFILAHVELPSWPWLSPAAVDGSDARRRPRD